MTEETAVRIAEALEGIDSTISMIGALAASSFIIFMFGFLFCILTKD